MQRYVSALDYLRLDEPVPQLADLHKLIIEEMTGPDCIWVPAGCTSVQSYFGRATVLPFPFTVVFKYDDQPDVIRITDPEQLLAYAQQNMLQRTLEAKAVRKALRALSGQRCYLPRTEYRTPSKWQTGLTTVANFESPVKFSYGLLTVSHNSAYSWRGYKSVWTTLGERSS